MGKNGENDLKKSCGSLPEGVEVKIVNPQGMIIMGRTKGLSKEQKLDFEVLRRQYRNILDIITYDDLLERLRVIKDSFSSQKHEV